MGYLLHEGRCNQRSDYPFPKLFTFIRTMFVVPVNEKTSRTCGANVPCEDQPHDLVFADVQYFVCDSVSFYVIITCCENCALFV